MQKYNESGLDYWEIGKKVELVLSGVIPLNGDIEAVMIAIRQLLQWLIENQDSMRIERFDASADPLSQSASVHVTVAVKSRKVQV